jgi:1,4-alpha-glucan branching enzyme
MKELVSSLNKLYQSEPALYERSFDPAGFEWIEVSDAEQSVLVYARKGLQQADDLVIVLNLTPVPRKNYRIGLPSAGKWTVLFNSDETRIFGSNFTIPPHIISEQIHWQNKPDSGVVSLPALSGLILKWKG